MTDAANMAALTDDHRRAGQAIRAMLRPGERLLTHSLLLRSPGLEEPPPTSGDVLNTLNPFAGFTKAAREKGGGWAVFATALGIPQQDYDPSTLIGKAQLARRYGHIFCGVKNSEAGRLLDVLNEHATMDYGHRPAWIACTDQRVTVFADPIPASGSHYTPGQPLRQLLRIGVSLGTSLWKLVSNTQDPDERSGFSGSVLPVFELRPGAVAAVAAPPVEHMPRVMLWFTDQSWLIVSFGLGEPADHMTATLQPR
ncbi:hypothetical protein [Actinoplanes awajinensis]|uniref:Uncharacterized protein n=1 Tax=Actinoplanes awajinensis subsp. mycoplanecinus TaxID=135947 RepID=A0A101JL77_9ACTN|nr:hypothetical protein [Actinoplanes awajinensis]KUL28846.1 hypothetical protein ADL15_30570 [Actinoplanes awajinensis subsp. mycoplanecinus]